MSPTSTERAHRAMLCIALSLLVAGFAAATRADSGHRHEQAERLQAGTSLIGARQLYLDRCGACHGPRGQGTEAAASDFSEPDALVRLTAPKMEGALSGDHGGRLGASLSEDERDRVIGFVRNYLMLPAPDADTEIGRAIYARSCSVCHGDRGDSASWARNSLDPAPVDFTAHGRERLSRETMIDAVTFGEDGTAMMAFAVQLTQEEIAATVDYVRAAFMPDGMGAENQGHDHDEGHVKHGEKTGEGHASVDAPFPGDLVGEPVRGRLLYEANCAECHGTEGDGQGRRAYFMLKKPENFLSRHARSELDRPHLYEAVSKGVIGAPMPAWEKVLAPGDIADVAEYVYRAFLRPDRFDPVAAPAPGWKRSAAQSVESKKN